MRKIAINLETQKRNASRSLPVTQSEFPQTFLTNPSKLRIYLCKIPTVITETLTVSTKHKNKQIHVHFNFLMAFYRE
jgi:hypothetical protein